MSVEAEIVVLFDTPRVELVVPAVSDFARIEDADLHCWISSTGQLEYQPDARGAPLIGELSLDGRLWRGSLGRLWTPDNSDYGGNPSIYACTLRAIVAMPGVVHAWYGVLTDGSGCRDVEAVTDAWIESYFDAAKAT